jgi:antitoxin HigA-1
MTNGASVLNGAMGMPTKLKSWISLGDNRMTKKLKPVHPGEILREEFMLPLRLSMNRVAMDLRVPVTRIADIVNEKRAITADTALRFARYFNNSPTFWMNLQTRYDLEVAEDEIADKVERDVRPLEAVPAK